VVHDVEAASCRCIGVPAHSPFISENTAIFVVPGAVQLLELSVSDCWEFHPVNVGVSQIDVVPAFVALKVCIG